MSILKFNEKDFLVAKVMPAGYYSFEVVEIGEPRKSSSDKSFNIFSKFRVIEDEHYNDKELKITFNTGMDNSSTLGTMYFMPHTMLLYLAAATAGTELDEVPKDLDTESLKGLKFDGKVEKVISDGIVLNTISSFLPFGSGREKEREGSPF